jgi:hypothetical protein
MNAELSNRSLFSAAIASLRLNWFAENLARSARSAGIALQKQAPFGPFALFRGYFMGWACSTSRGPVSKPTEVGVPVSRIYHSPSTSLLKRFSCLHFFALRIFLFGCRSAALQSIRVPRPATALVVGFETPLGAACVHQPATKTPLTPPAVFHNLILVTN